VPPGWDEWDAIASEPTASRYYDYTLDRNGAIVSYGDDPSDYSTTVLTDLALRFLRTARAPFFLEFAPIAPHRPATPAPGDAGLEQGNVPSDPPGYDERDVTDKPWLGRYPPLTKNAATAIHHYAADAAASLAALDRGVGEIMQLVEARGGLSNTVIVYMSDNVYMLG
jgi:arylsulfatase A-like enzyme